MILRHLLLPDILELVEANRLNEVRDFLAKQPAPEITDLLAALDDKDALLIFRVLPRTLADEVFSLLEPNLQNWMLKNMAQEEVRQVLKGLTPDDRTALFEELPARVVKGLLTLLSDKDRKLALTLLGYPEGSVGRLMTDRYVTVNPDWTVTQTLDHLRAAGMDSETMTMIYITDSEGHLVDDLRLRRLILAAPMTRVRDLLDGHYASLTSLQDREEAVGIFQDYDLFALPVVDADNVLLGIVTVDDILDVAEEEATEDFHKMGTVRPLQVSLKDATIGLLFRKRIGWLLGLVVVNVFTAMGIKGFQTTIEKVAVLVSFMPLLIGSGGNAGSQAATLLVRAMATGDIDAKDWWSLFLRSMGGSLLIGAVMAAAIAVMSAFILAGDPNQWKIMGIVAASMFAIVLMGSLIGTLLPMLLEKLHLDPASASAPLISSVSDILGILVYFSIATLFFRWLPIG